jgi:putative intracellular protease/amidase
MRFHFLASAIFALTFSSVPVVACKCVLPPKGLTARDLAIWNASGGGDAIFEGRVELVEWKWTLMEAKVGDLIPADLEQGPPFMQVSLGVSRSYRGVQDKNIQVRTGLGGGDCGFDFEVGKQYLVYASADETGQLSTDICSGTALLEESQTSLSYLRGEPITTENAEGDTATAKGKLCGRVVRAGLNFADSQVFFLRVGNKSPIPSDEAEPSQDGSFCATDLIPGKYYLVFVNRAQDSPISFVFFPGVAKSLEATAIEVKSGQANPELVFNVPPQPTFSISGKVLASDKSGLPAECRVTLLNADPLSFLLGYTRNIASSGSFDFSQVLPGRYWAFATVDSDAASSWLTRKVEVDVDERVANLSLELIAK